jgi:hypothetical protein
VLLGATIVGAGYWYAYRNEPVTLVHPALTPGVYEGWRERLERSPRVSQASDAALRAAWEALHRAEVEAGRPPAGGGDPPSESVAGAALAWETAAEGAIQETTPELFVDLGRRLAVEFVASMPPVIALCAASGAEPAECLSARADDPAVSRYIPLGGLFLEFAARNGFTETAPGGVVFATGREPLLVAVYLDHYTRAIRETYALESLLTAEELEWLHRWKAEFQLDGNVDRRVEAALSLSRVPGYPAALNAGVLRYHAGQFAAAAAHFGQAPEPIAALYRRLALRAADAEP